MPEAVLRRRHHPRSRSADLEAADELGYRIKLLGVAQRTDAGIEQRVHPTMVPQGLRDRAGRRACTNAVTIDADAMAPITLVGPGAGGAATASAVVADIGDIAARPSARRRSAGRPRASTRAAARPDAAPRGRLLHPPRRASTGPAPPPPSRRAHGRRRTFRSNRSCSAAAARGRTAATIRSSADEPAPVILITYATTEDAVRRALAAIEQRRRDCRASRR